MLKSALNEEVNVITFRGVARLIPPAGWPLRRVPMMSGGSRPNIASMPAQAHERTSLERKGGCTWRAFLGLRLAATLVALLVTFVHAQTQPERQFRGGKLVSKSDPSVVLKFGKAFHYAGGQVIDIFKVAGAEQHFFVDAAPDGALRRFYWVQFEHYYPSNHEIYDYTGIKQQPLQIGPLAFMADVSVESDYFSDDRVGSDAQAAAKFLLAKGYKLSGTFVRLRLFHLPDASRRKELMVIYGEALPAGSSEEQARSAVIQRAQENLRAR